MVNGAFDLGEELKLRELSYTLHSTLWNKYDLSAIDLNLDNWFSIKYLNPSGNALNKDIERLPKNSGGLYMFSIKCLVVPGMTDFPVYIGRALKSENQSLNKRCKEYFQKYFKHNERPKITRMFRYWANDLYLSYMPINENQTIIDFEKKLINTLLLPFNDQIPDIEIRQAVKAFNL